MSNFYDFRDMIISSKSNITKMIEDLRLHSYNEQTTKEIEAKFQEIRSSISESEDQITFLEPGDRIEAKKFIQQISSEIKKLEHDFTKAVKRGSVRDALFGNSLIKDDDDVPVGEKHSTFILNDQIEDGNDVANDNGGSQDSGGEVNIGVQKELKRQKSDVKSIDDNLNGLENDNGEGDNFMDKMICGNKRRTVFMIIIIVILIIAAAIFLYFIFRDK